MEATGPDGAEGGGRFGEDGGPGDEEPWFHSPPPPDDRLWRHPSEVGAAPRPPALRPVWGTAVLAGMVGSVLTVAVLTGAGMLTRQRTPTERVVRETVRSVSAVEPRPQRGVERIASSAQPSTVRLEIGGGSPGSGSGVVFRTGYVLTSAHVVADADEVTVVMADRHEVRGIVVGLDRPTDIAVVRLKDADATPTAVLGSAEDLRVGEMAVAVGSPLGLTGSSSVTTGVVSALGREVESEDGTMLFGMIQTDAAIAPGSSGGALLDATGAVVGITTALALTNRGAEGLGFATPVDIARHVADQLIETGTVAHAWLGIEGRDVKASDPEGARIGAAPLAPGIETASTLDAQPVGGVLVEGVHEGSPAAIAGLGEGDLVLALDGEDVLTMGDLVVAIRAHDPGDEVLVDYRRGQERRRIAVTLAERG